MQCKMAAYSEFDVYINCPSPENPDSRKRPLNRDIEHTSTKRSHYIGGGDGIYHFKILVPSIASGAIMGKGGETIAQLQKDTNARVQMSNASDFYPGTAERVCLISGSVDAIMYVLTFIMDKIQEKPEQIGNKNNMENKTGPGRDKKVKILVPNSTAGRIIGKGGNYIKQVQEESGSYVQISQKPKDQSLQERCITVIGELENNHKACMLILAKVVEDPQSGSCPNVSYADISGPVASYHPSGSPFVYPTGQNTSSNLNSSVAVSQLGLSSAPGLNLSLNLNSPLVGANQSITSQLLDQIKIMLRSSGCSEHVTAEISTAMATLAKYGILKMELGAGGLGAGSHLEVSSMDATLAQANGVLGSIGTPTPTRLTSDLVFDPLQHPSPASPPSTSASNNTPSDLGSAKPEDLKDTKTLDIEIPEKIVGAILGPGGRSLMEIQAMSGASIQISKKGTFAPGTRNRVVSISGSPAAVGAAQILIEKRIGEEEIKRNRHSPQ